MKTTISIFIILTLICVRTMGQQTISDLTANAIEAKSDFISIYDLDVFSFYELREYNTDLKKALFKKTQEYQDLLDKLKSKKSEMFRTSYFSYLDEKFNNINYDLKRQGFEIEIGSNLGMGTMSARTPKSIQFHACGTILLKAIPTRQVSVATFGHGIYIEKLFLNISEEMGLEIENDKVNILIYFFFTPIGREKTTFKFYNNTSNSYAGWYNITHDDLKADKVRIIVANKLSGKIYYNKLFTDQTIQKHKKF